MNYSVSDIGLERNQNEDACISYEIQYRDQSATIMILADGMGGVEAGDIASTMFLELSKNIIDKKLSSFFKINNFDNLLLKAFSISNDKIFEYSHKKSIKIMGSTGVIAIIYKDILYGAWVGDSRIYTYRNSQLNQLSKDHSYVQELLDSNVLTEEEAFKHPKKNIITRAVGISNKLDVSLLTPVNLNKGDILLLSSDGLHGYLSNKEILDILNNYFKNNNTEADKLNKISKLLLSGVYSAGAPDNISLVINYHE